MCRSFLKTLIVSVLVYTGSVTNGLASKIDPGLYEVKVRVLLPNVYKVLVALRKEICITKKMTDDNDVFRILSETPLSRCKRHPVIKSGRYQGFLTKCDGRSSAFANAKYEYGFHLFSGRIEMNMGGKNMRVVEQQSGAWLRACTNKEKLSANKE